MDSFARTWVKALLWAAIGLVSMSVIGSLCTGSLSVGGMMTLSNTLIGLAIYVIYERVWSRISWGVRTATAIARTIPGGDGAW